MKQPGKRRRFGRGALVMLALFLCGSGALRLGMGIGDAVARTPEFDESPTPVNCPAPPTALLDAIREREAELDARDAAIAERSAALALADQAIEERLAKLQDAEEKLAATLHQADGAAEADIARLTEVYETMKPKTAANLFAAMDPEFAVGFLGRMRPDAAAAILSGMNPEQAYSISARLAARHADVPKN